MESSSKPTSRSSGSNAGNSASAPTEYAPLPRTSSQRLHSSLKDEPLELSSLIENVTEVTIGSQDTVFYLAYGSNLCRETFRGKRGIRPISQINVVVPELVMTFDLAGMPYSEPCFSNTRSRDPVPVNNQHQSRGKERYHKDAWHKGLVGAVYEVTMADYARIMATEGGGASYQDVVVKCYPLSEDPSVLVPAVPTGSYFKAHTLSAPAASASKSDRPVRPDPSYAQASPRYMKLLRDGADELGLPSEYKQYLHSIRPFHMTTNRQRVGKSIFMAIWYPLIAFCFAAGRNFADKQGRYPPWLASLTTATFVAQWASYDHFFKDWFGDGERTMETESGDQGLDAQPEEKQALMSDQGDDFFADTLEDSVLPNMAHEEKVA